MGRAKQRTRVVTELMDMSPAELVLHIRAAEAEEETTKHLRMRRSARRQRELAEMQLAQYGEEWLQRI